MHHPKVSIFQRALASIASHREYSFNEKAGLNKIDSLPIFSNQEALEPNNKFFDVTHRQMESIYEELLK